MPDGAASAPLAFLTVDGRVPATLQDLLVEADGCLKNGFFTGGTACVQRAIHALLTLEGMEGSDYKARLRSLSEKYPALAQVLFTVLMVYGEAIAHDEAKLDADRLRLLIVTVKAVTYEIYVLGPERAERLRYVRQLLESIDSIGLKHADTVGPRPSLASAGATPKPTSAT